jgi:hypothetical protein
MATIQDSLDYYEDQYVAEASVHRDASASCYGRAKYVLVQPIVVPEFKLRHVERKIFLADLMERANYATLEDRPEPFAEKRRSMRPR